MISFRKQNIIKCSLIWIILFFLNFIIKSFLFYFIRSKMFFSPSNFSIPSIWIFMIRTFITFMSLWFLQPLKLFSKNSIYKNSINLWQNITVFFTIIGILTVFFFVFDICISKLFFKEIFYLHMLGMLWWKKIRCSIFTTKFGVYWWKTFE